VRSVQRDLVKVRAGKSGEVSLPNELHKELGIKQGDASFYIVVRDDGVIELGPEADEVKHLNPQQGVARAPAPSTTRTGRRARHRTRRRRSPDRAPQGRRRRVKYITSPSFGSDLADLPGEHRKLVFAKLPHFVEAAEERRAPGFGVARFAASDLDERTSRRVGDDMELRRT
jgi:bifunctional DNA-binding transcriptional regulator/antitoxin component of YhaV-PrlF toxin-antitoxin module